MRREEPLGFLMAIGDDLQHFLIDGTRRLVAEGLRTSPESVEAVEVGVLARCQLHEAEAIAHSPAGHHVSGKGRCLLDVVLRASGLCAVHHLLGGTPTEHADDSRAQIGLRIVVAIAVGPLIRDT